MKINNKLIVFSAPSGSGKTSILKPILDKYKTYLSFSISATSRNKRENEENNKDYYFLSVEDFKSKINNNEFIEWEEVYKDTYYGTLLSEIDRIWSQGKIVIFDIDVKGALNIKSKFPDDCTTIFIEPPSIAELEKRLRNRSTETEETLLKRLNRAREELSYKEKFDIVVTNDDLETAIKNVDEVVGRIIKIKG